MTDTLRFQVVADGRVLVDELVGPVGTEDATARHFDIARQALERGEIVTLVVRDPDQHDAVVCVATHDLRAT